MWQPGHVPSLAPLSCLSLHLSSEPALPQSGLSGCGGCCRSAPKTETCKPSAINPAKSYFVWPQPPSVSERTRMVKPPWGGGALQSLFRQTLPREEGEVEGQEGLLRLCLGAGQQHTLLLLVCSTSIPWLCVSLCPHGELSPFSEDIHFVFPAAHPPAIPGCPLPGAEAADVSQGRGTQDALWSLELSLNGKETLIYALSSRKYFFKRHCSYLRCSYTTASHK